MERAIQVVRFHGDCQFAQGGSAEDVLATMKTYGIVPEGTMPFPGSLYGDSLNNFNEFFHLLEPYVAAIAKSDAKKISNQWKVGLQGILDAYLGKCPEEFTYEGKMVSEPVDAFTTPVRLITLPLCGYSVPFFITKVASGRLAIYLSSSPAFIPSCTMCSTIASVTENSAYIVVLPLSIVS